MSALRQNYPQSEAGLIDALSDLEVARTHGDDEWAGSIMLQLSQLVKWVRSDNDEPPFQRAETIALDALEAFQKTGNVKGQVASLIQAISPFKPLIVQERLEEAARLAESLGDPLLIAQVTAATGRNMGMRDRDVAKRLDLEALGMFRELDHKPGIAGCLFSLIIVTSSDQEAIEYALEGSRAYREIDDIKMSAKCLSLAAMHSKTTEQLNELEPHFRRALDGAHTSGDRHTEQICYRFFARLLAMRGDAEEAERYGRWASDLDPRGSLPPEERLENDIAMTIMLKEASRSAGNKDGVRDFKASLRDLKRQLKNLKDLDLA